MTKQKKNTQITSADSMAFRAVQIEPIVVPTAVDVKGSGKFIKWGVDNKMPNYLYDCFLSVSNLQSILLTYADYICGNDIITNSELINSEGETVKEVIKKCVMDWLIFGCFAVECIRNGKGEIANLIYQDVRNLRVNEDMTTAYLASEWGSFSAKNTAELPLYNRKEVQPHFIYYCHMGRGWYGVPIYFAALKSIEILKRTRDFHLKNLENNFAANAIITFCNGVPSKTVQEEIFDKINNTFCGTENASKVFVNFADNQDSAPKIERLTEDKFGDLYQALATSSTDDVYQACRINKMLLGANVATGFSREEFNECSKLFQQTTITPIQNMFTDAFGKIGFEINFEKYTLE